ncbi:MAG: hypothetical protein JNL82_00450 [Myxococcales bacterium]|nr:hypothetical protein [Myxococcales bacterium]
MRSTIPRQLVVPAFLAVSAVVAPACKGGDDDTTMGSEATAASEPTGTPTGTVTDTGELPDCQMNADQAACTAIAGCVWFVEVEQCIVECETITDQLTCQMQDYCEWFDDQCSMLLA